MKTATPDNYFRKHWPSGFNCSQFEISDECFHTDRTVLLNQCRPGSPETSPCRYLLFCYAVTPSTAAFLHRDSTRGWCRPCMRCWATFRKFLHRWRTCSHAAPAAPCIFEGGDLYARATYTRVYMVSVTANGDTSPSSWPMSAFCLHIAVNMSHAFVVELSDDLDEFWKNFASLYSSANRARSTWRDAVWWTALMSSKNFATD